ncbi:MAG: cobalamin-dependent protein, partial [Planctomycetota bacterium]
MRILLVRPPITLDVAQKLRSFLHLEPLALEIVAGGFGRRHDVHILDLASTNDPEDRFRSELREVQPDILGFTSYSNQACNTKRLARNARTIRPDLMI